MAREKQAPLLMRSALSSRIYVVIRYKNLCDGMVEALEKYDITDQFDALASAGTLVAPTELPGEVCMTAEFLSCGCRDCLPSSPASPVALRGRLAAVLDLHRPYRGPTDPDSCEHCNRISGREIRYPCPTALAAERTADG